MLTQEQKRTALAAMSFHDFLARSGYATFMMTEDCGNSEVVQVMNNTATINQFIEWAEAQGASFASLAILVRTAYADLPNGDEDA